MGQLQRLARIGAAGLLAAICFFAAAARAEEKTNDKTVIKWRFDKDGDFRGWQPSGMIAEAAVAGGALSGRATGNDPIIMGPVFEIPARALQYVEICMKAAAPAQAELFWTETLEGRYGGFEPDKHRLVHTKGDGQFHVYRVWPFWHAAGKIIRLRFDPPNEGRFEIRWIRIAEHAAPGAAPVAEKSWAREQLRKSWTPCDDVEGQAGGPILLSPLLSIPAAENAFVCVRMAADRPGSGRLFCVSRTGHGWDSLVFPLRPDGKLHSYNIDASRLKTWRDQIVLLGLQVPNGRAGAGRIESVEVAPEPRGPVELQVAYFGPSDGINRAGRPAGVTCTLRNLGGEAARNVTATLEVPPGVSVIGGAEKKIDRLSLYMPKTVDWEIRATAPGQVHLAVKVAARGLAPIGAEASLELTPAPDVPKAAYVPEPRPVPSKYDVGVFYFPGWATADRWRPILGYPNRKPILGWYDESNPECADWQIKWAVEHGVKFFMVDWYWCQGNRHLEHWLHDAYGKAKHRRYLKWAIMWANHNPPNTHSAEDWRKVTQYWIDHYFAMPEYYRIEGRPAVFVWAPANVRRDLGGSRQAAELYATSQQMAKAAGYPGIYFVAMSSHHSADQCRQIAAEGFEGLTMYHGFQLARQRAGSDRFPFAGLLDTCPELWRQADERAGDLLHVPIVDTGWDARPWHGAKSMVAHGRTPELFGKLCRLARKHADATGKRIIAIGPWNEWGEGSYIEPYAEYGFEDLDQLRQAFCEPGDWPPNLVPADVGLGPYDLNFSPPKTAWEFNADGDLEGWSANGHVADREVKGGLLSGRSTGHDPILSAPALQVEAAQTRRLVLGMRSDKPQRVQVFWATTLSSMSEKRSMGIDVPGDGQLHEHQLDLGQNPFWRGMVVALRIDPANEPGVRFAIDYVRLQ